MTSQLHTEQGFLEQVEANRAMIHKVCHVYCHHPADREDLFQEIVVQLWKAWPGFRGESRFTTWLYRIALNTAISGLRKNRAPTIYMEPGLLPEQLKDDSEHPDKEEKIGRLYAAIRQLSELDRAMVMLYLEEKSYEEMEEILGINQSNLRVKMNRAKEKLRKLINGS